MLTSSFPGITNNDNTFAKEEPTRVSDSTKEKPLESLKLF